MKLRLHLFLFVVFSSIEIGYAVSPTAEEMAQRDAWVAAQFQGLDKEGATPFFSLVYQGQAFAEILSKGKMERSSRQLDTDRTEHILVYTDTETGLEIRCEGMVYRSFPAVEWILYFTNTGTKDTGIMENIRTMDLSLTADSGEFVLHHAKGSQWSIADFQPLTDALAPNTTLEIQSAPWPSAYALPFFNVEWDGHGIIAGIGWTEGWAASFARDGQKSLAVQIGPSLGHFLLHPGEKVRSLRMLLLFWQGNRIHGHNLWRQLILKHYSPMPGGKLLQGPLCHGNWGWYTTQQHIERLSWWKKHDLPMEVYWMDIGWERDPTEEEAKEHLAMCVVDEKKNPNGLKPISDACHEQGLKYLLWFGSGRLWPNPDRVAKFRPELLSEEYPGTDSSNPMINAYMTQHFGDKFADWGVDVFRPDAHSTPPPDSSPDRQGINMARSAEGFCAFWDALLERFPNLIIDNCCAGGENIDLETMKRSIPLWRSDSTCREDFNPITTQVHTYSLSFWVPLSTGVIGDACLEAGIQQQPDPYSMRSGYSPSIDYIWFNREVSGAPKMPEEGFDFTTARRILNEYLSVRKYFYGDYYPLTKYSVADDVWLAWQFNSPDASEGMVQAFRRERCPYLAAQLRLGGLESEALYTLTNSDVAGTTEMTGRELMEKGLLITISDQPGAVLITYKKVEK